MLINAVFFDKNSKINYIVITIENNCFLF